MKTILYSIMAGIFIALASHASTMIAYPLLSQPSFYGLGRCLAGLIFPAGLIFVVITRSELFTGKVLLFSDFLSKKITATRMFKKWSIIYLGNFLGSLLIAFLIYHSGQFSLEPLRQTTIAIAQTKASLPFLSAFILGILCNVLVCLAVLLSKYAASVTGKTIAIFFPIWLFVASGFEHSVANMFYLSVGIMLDNSLITCLPALSNLIAVTLGNIVGGMLIAVTHYYRGQHE